MSAFEFDVDLEERDGPRDPPHFGGTHLGGGVHIHGPRADIDHYHRHGWMVSTAWIATGPGDMYSLEEVR